MANLAPGGGEDVGRATTPWANWPHRWFGFWADPGDEPGEFPQIGPWLRPDIAVGDGVDAAVNYLTTARHLTATSRSTQPCMVCGERGTGSLCVRTDGVWLWWDNLDHYIEAHGLVLPDGLRERIEQFGGVPPAATREQITSLECPSTWTPENRAFVLGLKRPGPSKDAPA